MSRWTLQLSAGRGPMEVREFVKLLSKEIETRFISHDLYVHSKTVHGDDEYPHSIELDIEGNPLLVQSILGTHLLLSKSKDRSPKSRKRWFAGVSMHQAANTKTIQELHPKDVEIRTMKASGPGGQHVNTTDSAVRVRHIKSGISVRVSSQRSQFQNRRKALKHLSQILQAKKEVSLKNRDRTLRRSHYQFERGNPVQTWIKDSNRNGGLFLIEPQDCNANPNQ